MMMMRQRLFLVVVGVLLLTTTGLLAESIDPPCRQTTDRHCSAIVPKDTVISEPDVPNNVQSTFLSYIYKERERYVWLLCLRVAGLMLPCFC
jgi:hypothetical protein